MERRWQTWVRPSGLSSLTLLPCLGPCQGPPPPRVSEWTTPWEGLLPPPTPQNWFQKHEGLWFQYVSRGLDHQEECAGLLWGLTYLFFCQELFWKLFVKVFPSFFSSLWLWPQHKASVGRTWAFKNTAVQWVHSWPLFPPVSSLCKSPTDPPEWWTRLFILCALEVSLSGTSIQHPRTGGPQQRPRAPRFVHLGLRISHASSIYYSKKELRVCKVYPPQNIRKAE